MFRAVCQCPRCGQVFGVIGENAVLTDSMGNVMQVNISQSSASQPAPVENMQQKGGNIKLRDTRNIRKQSLVTAVKKVITAVLFVGIIIIILYLSTYTP